MVHLKAFVFNDFQENTYVLHDETKECIIIDPGCYTSTEQSELSNYISANALKPVKVVNTHCHIDHVLGNNFCCDKYGIALHLHRQELITYEGTSRWAELFGLSIKEIPDNRVYINEGDIITFGNNSFQIFLTPGHSIASLSFYSKENNMLISGDVLFCESIGRTDLPGGNYEQLIQSIRSKLFILPDSTMVYAGHGPSTSIGHEKKFNPFLN
jgi:glyoxylase-like metal-dependent hydrolase (beta-lactamase superfamily II)